MNKFGKRILTAAVCAALMMGTMTGCSGVSKTATVATMDGEKITLNVANFMLRFNQAGTESYLGALFGTDNLWEQDLTGSGTAYGDTFKDQMMDSLKTMLILEKHMSEYQVEITEEEQAEIKAAAEQFIADNSKEVLDAMMADQETVERVLTLYTIQDKMREAIEADVDTEVSDEEAAQKTVEYAFLTTGSYTNDEGETVERTDEEKEEIKQQAQSIIDAVKDGETLEDALKAVDETKTTSTTSYGTAEDDDSYVVEEMKTAAETLTEDGQIYDEPVQTDNGFYVVQMKSMFDEEATEERKEEIVEERKDALYDEKLEGWEPEEFTVNTKVWDKVTYFDKYTVYQEPETETEAASETEAVSETEATSETEAATETETAETE
ncbi:MAG: peptidylprolyl isomerase [Eubacteriales bacterium]|nr:peptidylprolyl isomerase [Eubacteriales bacterium]